MTTTRMRMMWTKSTKDTGFRYAEASDDSDENDDASDENSEAGDDDGDAGGDDEVTACVEQVPSPASSGVCTCCPLAMTCRPGTCQRRSVVVCASLRHLHGENEPGPSLDSLLLAEKAPAEWVARALVRWLTENVVDAHRLGSKPPPAVPSSSQSP